MRRHVVLWASFGLIVASVAAVTGWQRQTRYAADLDRILIRADAHRERFDSVRHFVHGHTRHAVDAEFEKLVGDKSAIAALVADYAEGKQSEPAHLECSTRSNLLVNLFRKLGYRARIVYVFDADRRNLASHTFVDIYNPLTAKWESQDPDNDLYWRDITSGERVSIFDSAEDLRAVEPCGPQGCGWELVTDEGHRVSDIRELIDIVSTIDKANNERLTRFTSRANLDREFSFKGRTGRFCDIMEGLCEVVVK
jgi:hypothetical protein